MLKPTNSSIKRDNKIKKSTNRIGLKGSPTYWKSTIIVHKVKHYEGGSNNISRKEEEEEEEEEDNHTAEINHNEDEHFEDECRNLKDDDTFSMLYGKVNTLPLYNNNQKMIRSRNSLQTPNLT